MSKPNEIIDGVEYETVCALCEGEIQGIGDCDEYVDVCQRCGQTEGETIRRKVE